MVQLFPSSLPCQSSWVGNMFHWQCSKQRTFWKCQIQIVYCIHKKIYYRCNDHVDSKVSFRVNSGINLGLRRLFAVYVITLCSNWIINLVLWINNYWKQQTKNNKTQIMFFCWLKTGTSCSRFWINQTHLNQSETLKTVMSDLLFCEGFSVVHVIITTIIIND